MRYILASGACTWYTSFIESQGQLTVYLQERILFMKISIPGYRELNILNLILDYNGTIAVDGAIPDDVKTALIRLSEQFSIYVLTADTHGTARAMCQGLPLKIMTFPGDSAMDSKLSIVRSLGPSSCAAIGNGRNDCLMCKESALSIAVMGEEGACSALVGSADICTRSILDALSLLEKPGRLIATLRG